MNATRLTSVVLALALGGCGHPDGPVEGVIAMRTLAENRVEACASYTQWVRGSDGDLQPFARTRRIEIDLEGRLSAREGDCEKLPFAASRIALSDGGWVALTVVDATLTRYAADGSAVWTSPSPFGKLSAAAEVPGFLFIAGGPQAARVALADGNVSWVVELR
jgi:hypothetical protein